MRIGGDIWSEASDAKFLHTLSDRGAPICSGGRIVGHSDCSTVLSKHGVDDGYLPISSIRFTTTTSSITTHHVQCRDTKISKKVLKKKIDMLCQIQN